MTSAWTNDWLAYHAVARAEHVACIDLGSGRRFTYRALFERVMHLAGALRERYGVRAGDRVMVLARNSTDLFEIQFAAWRIGAIFMPVNWRLASAEIANILHDASPALVICDAEFVALLPAPTTNLLLRVAGHAQCEYELSIGQSRAVDGFLAADLDTPNTLLYTSGTTGEPKGVVGTWRMTMTTVLQAGPTASLSSRSVTLTAAPLFHTAGLNSFATPSFHYGGTVAVMHRWEAGAALDHLTDAALGVTHTLGVPTQYLLMTQHEKFAQARFTTLQIAAVGGAPPSLSLLRACAERGLPLTPGYGMTEVFGVATAPPEVALAKSGAVGWPAPYTEIRIAAEDGEACAAGVVGEIWLRGPGVTPGYWRRPAETRAAFSDGWFHSGDLGYLDADGLLYLVDRKKDMFISGGENVYPAEIENAVASLTGIDQVAVIGVPHATWGEVGAAFITLRPNATLTTECVLAHCRKLLAGYKVPQQVSVVDSLPLSAQGKVLKNELRRRRNVD
jgi:fatty-acyl-CoA synthase